MRSRLTLVLLTFAGPALAGDGVLEINQICAAKAGCFGGDTAGYPVTIDGTGGGSYRLTSNLVVPDKSTSGIRVSTSNVTIDLNGFEILGEGCVAAAKNCTPVPDSESESESESESGSRSGSGVERSLISNRGISVRNGSITGMGLYGVILGHQAEVSGLRVRWNGRDGIFVSEGSTVRGNTAYQNGDDGIQASRGSTVSGNTAFQNGGDGIFAGSGSTISGNTAYLNGQDGIISGFGSTVSGNTANENGSDGIAANRGSTVQRNTVWRNGGFGLNLLLNATGFTSAFRENVITNNMTGTVNGGVNMGNNSCDGKPSCP
jgi:parallel beta-helix repeat protein